jgi:Secretion system C-terminal sorting domain
MSIFPNPIINQASVQFILQDDGAYRLELYNAGGKLVSIVAEGNGVAGQQVVQELQGDKLLTGIYYLRLITNNEVQTVRILLNK